MAITLLSRVPGANGVTAVHRPVDRSPVRELPAMQSKWLWEVQGIIPGTHTPGSASFEYSTIAYGNSEQYRGWNAKEAKDDAARRATALAEQDWARRFPDPLTRPFPTHQTLLWEGKYPPKKIMRKKK
jgi:hypothetical protein